MPILDTFAVPASVEQLSLPETPDAKFFIAFISSKDPVTNLPWCPDVRAALPYLITAFTEENAPNLAVVEVGQKAE